MSLAVALATTAPTLPEHVVAVGADGWPWSITHKEALEGSFLADADHLWIWSAGTPPEKIEPTQWGEAVRPSQGGTLVVTVAVGEDREQRRDVQLIAAPVRMWEEVPESLLPRFDVPKAGTVSIPVDGHSEWRVRAVGADEGSWWTDIPAGQAHARIAVEPAEARRLDVRGPDGTPPDRVWAYLQAGSKSRKGGGRTLAAVAGATRGTLSLDRIPDTHELTVVVMAVGCVPQVLRSLPSRLPREPQLEKGSTLHGRVLDGDSKPVADVVVWAEFWASDQVAFGVTRYGKSKANGSWRIENVRPGEVALSAAKPGYVGLSNRMTVAEESQDVGDLVLVAGLSVPVVATDDVGLPVPEARLRAGAGVTATTDKEGKGQLVGVSATSSVTVEAAAEGHLPASFTFPQPIPDVLRLKLTRSLTVEGRFQHEDGPPVTGGDVRVEQQHRWHDTPLAENGEFNLELQPRVPATLTLLSQSAARVVVDVSPGAPGEQRDLGAIDVPNGLVVTGQALSEADGQPVAGARVWTVRPTPEGPLLAWMLNDIVSTTTDADGTFALLGLPVGPAVVRIDAPGLARRHIPVEPDSPDGLVDLGVVYLETGTTLRIEIDGKIKRGAVAEVDLQGQAMPFDVISAPVEDGEAVLENIGSGTVTFTVRSDRTVFCGDELTLDGSRSSVDVVCEAAALTVVGEVRVGEQPASSGQLIWRWAQRSDLPSGIMNVTSPSGLRRQWTYSMVPTDVPVDVVSDGTFETDELRPGRWEVCWWPSNGSPSPPKPVDIPQTDRFETTLTYPGFEVSGIVLNKERRPVAEAQVEIRAARGLALSGPDGTFRIGGLEAGRWTVEARRGDQTSEPVEAVIQSDGRTDPITLVLTDDSKETVEVAVRAASGVPAGGAFVFVETDSGDSRIASADANGRVTFSFPSPVPQRLRFASKADGAWVLSAWRTWKEARRGISLAVGRVGSLLIVVEEKSGRVDLATLDGWNIGWLSTRIGAPLLVDPSRPLRVSGLPLGGYSVAVGGTTVSATVRASRETEVEIH